MHFSSQTRHYAKRNFAFEYAISNNDILDKFPQPSKYQFMTADRRPFGVVGEKSVLLTFEVCVCVASALPSCTTALSSSLSCTTALLSCLIMNRCVCLLYQPLTMSLIWLLKQKHATASIKTTMATNGKSEQLISRQCYASSPLMTVRAYGSMTLSNVHDKEKNLLKKKGSLANVAICCV